MRRVFWLLLQQRLADGGMAGAGWFKKLKLCFKKL
jgi:hypothetical protein